MYKKGAGGWKGMRDRKGEEDSGRVRGWERERERLRLIDSFIDLF